MKTLKPTDAAELGLGITKAQIVEMQETVNALELQNDAIGLTRVRRAVDQRLVEIRLLLRDGDLKRLNGGR